jgi:hypothetical protein
MNLKTIGLGLMLWAVGGLSDAWAVGLTWSATDLAIKADTKKPTTEAVYAFKNESVQTVVIQSAAACCDCVQVSFAKSGSGNPAETERLAQGRALQVAEFKPGYPLALAPGEAGELRARFTLGARTGRQEKVITVTYLDQRTAPSVLRLSVDIPNAPVRLSTEMLHWKQGGATDEQAVDIILTDPERTTIDQVQCAGANFAVSLEPAKVPGSRRIVVKPLGTDKLVQATIRIQATVNGVMRVLLVQAMVR